MKIRLIDHEGKTAIETDLEPPPNGINFEDDFYTRVGIADGVASFKPGLIVTLDFEGKVRD